MDERWLGVDEVAVGGAGLGRPSAVVPLIHKSDGGSRAIGERWEWMIGKEG